MAVHIHMDADLKTGWEKKKQFIFKKQNHSTLKSSQIHAFYSKANIFPQIVHQCELIHFSVAHVVKCAVYSFDAGLFSYNLKWVFD